MAQILADTYWFHYYILGIFQYAHPLQKLSSIQTYACAMFGSNLWNLYGPAACQVYKCWNISVRDAWGVSRLTRTYIVDNLLSGSLPPIRQPIIRRYVRFVQGLATITNPVLSTLSHWATKTVQSVTGLNMANIRQEFGLDPLLHGPSLFTVKNKEIPENGNETLELIDNLLHQQLQETEPDIATELQAVINNLCER